MSSQVTFGSKASQRIKAARTMQAVPKTGLVPWEQRLAEDAWATVTKNNSVTTLRTSDDLAQLTRLVNVPTLASMVSLGAQLLASKVDGQFSYFDFLDYLQKCKTLHVRYRRKVDHCSFDDELLEAYVAVGGHADTTGSIDMEAIRTVARDFNLTIDLGDGEEEAAELDASARGKRKNPTTANNANGAAPLDGSSMDADPPIDNDSSADLSAQLSKTPATKQKSSSNSQHHPHDRVLNFKEFVDLLSVGAEEAVVVDNTSMSDLNVSRDSNNAGRRSPLLVPKRSAFGAEGAAHPAVNIDDLFRDDLADFVPRDSPQDASLTPTAAGGGGASQAMNKSLLRRKSFSTMDWHHGSGGRPASQPAAAAPPAGSEIAGVQGGSASSGQAGATMHQSHENNGGVGGGASQVRGGTRLAPLATNGHGPTNTKAAAKNSATTSPRPRGNLRSLPPLSMPNKGDKKHKFAT